MNKKIIFVLCFILFVLFFGCSKQKNENTINEATGIETKTEMKNEEKTPESAVVEQAAEPNNNTVSKTYSFKYYFESTDTYSDLNDLSYFVFEKPYVRSVKTSAGTFTDLSPLILLPNLEELYIILNSVIQDISPLASLIHLKKLSLIMCHNIESIAPISSLVNLQYLHITYADRYFEDLLPLHNLEVLYLATGSDNGPEEIDVVNIAKLASLKELSINPGSYNILGNIYNIHLLGNLGNLETLSFHQTAPELSWITGLIRLRKFELNNSVVDDLRPLLDLPNLVEVNLAFTKIKDISVLMESKTIKKVTGPRQSNELIMQFAECGIEYIESYSDR